MVNRIYGILKNWIFWIPILFRSGLKIIGSVLKPFTWIRLQVGHYWNQISQFSKNLSIGILIAVIVHLGHNTPWVRDIEDIAVDLMNVIQVDTKYLVRNKDISGDSYTFLDIDQDTYDAWGKPFHVPRDKLLELIKYSIEGKAKTIIVDIDLSKEGIVPSADEKFKKFIQNYTSDSPNLILLRTFAPEDRSGIPIIQKVFFEKELDSTPVHWAHPVFSKDLVDLRVRRWRLLEAGCLDNQPMWLPSPQLLTVIINRLGKNGWADLSKSLEKSLPDKCSDKPDLTDLVISIPGHELNLDSDALEQRLIYSYSNDLVLPDSDVGYKRVPAGMITETNQKLAHDLVQDKVVIIGASYYESKDLHYTPVGEMPGALIITNAIKSLEQYGQLRGPPELVKLCIEIILIVFMAWAFSKFHSIGGTILTGALLIIVLVPASFFLFKYGVWVGLAAPILGMQLHQIVADYEEMIELRSKVGK